jgi:hypothetical protein
MKCQYVDGEIKYIFEYVEDIHTINIKIVKEQTCEEYSVSFDERSKIFISKPVIYNPSILYKIFEDFFEERNKCATIIFETNEETYVEDNDIKKYTIRICLDLEYINDDIVFDVNIVDKPITPQQFVERIEHKFAEYIPEVERKITELRNYVATELHVHDDRVTMYINECFSGHERDRHRENNLTQQQVTEIVEQYLIKLKKDMDVDILHRLEQVNKCTNECYERHHIDLIGRIEQVQTQTNVSFGQIKTQTNASLGQYKTELIDRIDCVKKSMDECFKRYDNDIKNMKELIRQLQSSYTNILRRIGDLDKRKKDKDCYHDDNGGSP